MTRPDIDPLPECEVNRTIYIVQHPRTRMFLAKKERPKNIRLGSGFGQDYRWVRTHGEATMFASYADAELPGIFLNLTGLEIRPLLSCSLLGEPVDRETAMANGTFHKDRS